MRECEARKQPTGFRSFGPPDEEDGAFDRRLEELLTILRDSLRSYVKVWSDAGLIAAENRDELQAALFRFLERDVIQDTLRRNLQAQLHFVRLHRDYNEALKFLQTDQEALARNDRLRSSFHKFVAVIGLEAGTAEDVFAILDAKYPRAPRPNNVLPFFAP